MIRSLKKLAPDFCPQCDGKKSFSVTDDNKIMCQHCGYVVRDEHDKPVAAVEAPKPPKQRDFSKYPISYGITYNGEISSYAEAIYTTALDNLRRKNWEQAIKDLKRCINHEPRFSDALLWLARLTEDPEERRDYLTTILAEEPTHLEAQRELMILNGELSEDESDNFDEYSMPEQRLANAAISTRTKNLRCPRCNAPSLSDDDASGDIYCTSCGYREQKIKKAGKVGMLSQALIKRRSQSVQWIVGERLLKCNSCGAQRTIPAQKLSEYCPFCGSKHVVQKDVLGRFQQPDGIAPFAINAKHAMEKVEEQLAGWTEKVKGWFSDNRIKRSEISGVFLPFWCFDAICDVTRTIIDNRNNNGRYNERIIVPYQTMTQPDMANNVLICGVHSPSRELTSKLGKFRLDRAVEYTPERIAQHAAELYDIDFDKASMDVHEVVGKGMREKYYQPVDSGVQVNIFTAIKQMTFQLLLLPVYSVTLFEADGDVRPVLVNGHTGKVVLGKAKKP